MVLLLLFGGIILTPIGFGVGTLIGLILSTGIEKRNVHIKVRLLHAFFAIGFMCVGFLLMPNIYPFSLYNDLNGDYPILGFGILLLLYPFSLFFWIAISLHLAWFIIELIRNDFGKLK